MAWPGGPPGAVELPLHQLPSTDTIDSIVPAATVLDGPRNTIIDGPSTWKIIAIACKHCNKAHVRNTSYTMPNCVHQPEPHLPVIAAATTAHAIQTGYVAWLQEASPTSVSPQRARRAIMLVQILIMMYIATCLMFYVAHVIDYYFTVL
ncbi:jg11429 [Pararge aegeria aegeria]|uniref:Jg11429 protein n=1 Tax=Pararge aegeria aegeria TaxID=348720 RepID=A0A8S4RVL7_9NEOP|nr:jg11429 [Pararge aegeria aegeria]